VTQVTDRRLATAHTAPQEECIMKINEGTLDRALRVIVGLVLVVLAATDTVGLWGWIGLVPIATGLIGWCPAYTLLGVNTCSLRSR
jgi:Protein of unknown function (DUF2892)